MHLSSALDPRALGDFAHRSSCRVAPARPLCAIEPRLPVVHVVFRRAELCFHAVELGRISEGAVCLCVCVCGEGREGVGMHWHAGVDAGT